ncbi:Protein of unknown function, partial [Cotesia congregata]
NSGPNEEILANFEPELQEIILSAEIPPPYVDEFDPFLEVLDKEPTLCQQRSIVKVWFQNRRVKDKKAESIKYDKDKEMNSKTALPDTKIECKKRHVEIEKEKTCQNTSLAASAPAPAFASGSVIYGENQMHTLNYSSHSSSDTHNHHLSSWNLHNRINYDMIQNQDSNNFNGPDGRTVGNNHPAAIYSDSYNLNYNYIFNNYYYYPPGYNYQTADFNSNYSGSSHQ